MGEKTYKTCFFAPLYPYLYIGEEHGLMIPLIFIFSSPHTFSFPSFERKSQKFLAVSIKKRIFAADL